jgi:hypothetical protein
MFVSEVVGVIIGIELRLKIYCPKECVQSIIDVKLTEHESFSTK